MKNHGNLLLTAACIGLLLLWSPAASASDVLDCGPKVDLTPETSALLHQGTIFTLSAAETVQVSSGVKHSEIQVQRQGPNGEFQQGTVSCSLTCNGTTCLNRGCVAQAEGCTLHNCGSDCTGVCKQSTTWEPAPQKPDRN